MTSPQRYIKGNIRTRQSDGDWDYFPHGWLGRGYRVNAVELARLLRLEGRQTAVAAVLWIAASATISLIPPPETVGFPVAFFGGGLAAFLAAKIWLLGAVARHTRHLPRAERPLNWAQLQQ